MGRQRAAVPPALFGPRRRGALVLLVVGRLAGGDRLLDVLQRQSELARIELLGLAPELHSLELAQKMRETIVLPERRVALDDRGVPLGQRRGRRRRLELTAFHGNRIGVVIASVSEAIRKSSGALRLLDRRVDPRSSR